MKLLTGNDLITGDVIWWAGGDWSRLVADAVDIGSDADSIAKREEAARRVVGSYVIDAEAGPKGPVPLYIKERIRAAGPTMRLDLGIQAAETASESWVI